MVAPVAAAELQKWDHVSLRKLVIPWSSLNSNRSLKYIYKGKHACQHVFPPEVNHTNSTTWYNLFVKNKDRLEGNWVPVGGSLKCGNLPVLFSCSGKCSFWCDLPDVVFLFFNFWLDLVASC